MTPTTKNLCLLLAALAPLGRVLLAQPKAPARAPRGQPLEIAGLPLIRGQSPGAGVPFAHYEAEAPESKQARVVRMAGLPRGDDSTPEMEASGRAFAELAQTGDFIRFKSLPASNALVIRHCIPDAPEGGGAEATLSLYVNGKKRQALTLSSRHNWLYGEAGQNGQSNDPKAGQAHVFWDESRFFITGGLRRGDVLKLQKDEGDTAAFYRIDLIELEDAPAPLAPPPASTCLSVADFGADGSDDKDDSEAVQKCIEAARAQKKIVWMPAGTYFQSQKWTLDSVALRGAGMWRTNIIGTEPGETWGGRVGFELKGDGPAVSDLFIDCPGYTRRGEGAKPLTGEPTRFRVERVWVTHTNTGLWMNGSRGLIWGCRIRNTYADAINLNNGASDNMVEQNHVRGCGDDGLAILSETERNKPPSQNNTLRFNTVSANWWGHNCDVAGGSGHLIQDNIFADNARMGCLTINQPGAYPMNPLTGATFRGNVIARGGGNFAWQKRGAIWIYPGSTTISNVLFENNEIRDSIFRAIHLTGGGSQSTVWKHNLIEGVGQGEAAIHIDKEATGSMTFELNQVRKSPLGLKSLQNEAGDRLQVIEKGNSWQQISR